MIAGSLGRRDRRGVLRDLRFRRVSPARSRRRRPADAQDARALVAAKMAWPTRPGTTSSSCQKSLRHARRRQRPPIPDMVLLVCLLRLDVQAAPALVPYLIPRRVYAVWWVMRCGPRMGRPERNPLPVGARWWAANT